MNTSLFKACETGDVSTLRQLLQAGASPEGDFFPERGESTPLLVALYHKQIEAAKLLIQAGADVHYSGRLGSAASLAADCESWDLIKLLVKRGVAFPNNAAIRILRWAQPIFQTSLQTGRWENTTDQKIMGRLACESGNLPLLKQMATSYPDKPKLFSTALQRACEYEYTDIVTWLLQVHTFNTQELYQAIQEACRGEYPEIARALLPVYKAQNPPANQLSTLLLEFCLSPDNLSVVKTLVQAGVDVNYIDSQKENFSPLMVACLQGHLPLVQFLLEAGADVNLTNPKGSTSLMCACQHKDTLEIVKLLLKAGADVNHAGTGRYQDCFPPLLMACVTDNLALVQVLLQAGADVNITSATGQTALMCACENGRLSIVKVLVEAGADINAADNNGNTALMWGCEAPNLPLVQFLVEAGADITKKNRFGKTAYMKVRGNDWPDIEALLKIYPHHYKQVK